MKGDSPEFLMPLGGIGSGRDGLMNNGRVGDRVNRAAKRSGSKEEEAVFRSRRPESLQPLNSPFKNVFFLQRAIGNQAVQRLFRSGAIQAKMKTGQPNDIFEGEADRIADLATQTPESTVQPTPIEGKGSPSRRPVVQRGLEIPGIQRQPIPQEQEPKSKVEGIYILKTEKVKDAPAAYYGASFNHTFGSTPAGHSLQGIQVSELVSTQRDDFQIGATNVALGRKIWTLTEKNKLDTPDAIYSQAGSKGLGVNPLRAWPAVIDQNQIWYFRSSKRDAWELGPGITLKVTLSGDRSRKETLKVTTTDHGVSRTEAYRGPAIRMKE
jgi:hypothetical protein